MLLKRRKKHTHSEGSWAVSYVDMLTLLLCFFIIFYNNSNQKADTTPLQKIALELAGKKADGGSGAGGGEGDGIGNAAHSSKDGTVENGTGDNSNAISAVGKPKGVTGAGNGDGSQFGVNLWGRRAPADTSAAQKPGGNVFVSPEDLALLEMIKARIGTDVPAQLRMSDKSLEVNFEGLSFFDSGKIDIRPDAEKNLVKVITLLAKYKDIIHITVQGHTDPTQLNASKKTFSDNWELSALRATRVLKVFIKNGFSQEQLSAEGFAETKSRAPAEEMTAEELSKLRRITLRIEPLQVK